MEYYKAMCRLRCYETANIRTVSTCKSPTRSNSKNSNRAKYIYHKKSINVEYQQKRQSNIFTQLFYTKNSLQDSLQNFQFPCNIKIFPIFDPKRKQYFMKLKKIFKEIQFRQNELWMGELNNQIYVYFSQCKQIPKSQCCHSNVQVILSETINITCLKCRLLLQHIIIHEAKQPRNTIIKQIQQNYQSFSKQVSNIINSGRYKSKYFINFRPKMRNSQPIQMLVKSIKYSKNLMHRKSIKTLNSKIHQNTF